MISRMAKYKVKEECLDRVMEITRKFIQAVKDNEPETKYSIFRKEDGVTFIHVMNFTDSNAEKEHKMASYTKEFVGEIYPLCSSGLDFSDLDFLE